MNGISRLKISSSNGKKEENNENNEDEDEEEGDIDLAQPSTSRAGLLEEPKWNTATRQLYEDNFKSTASSASRKCGTSWRAPRERLPSVTDSTSSDDSCVYMYKGDGSHRNGNDVNKNVNCSSPEMDYLEMDFDPCQSNGHESSDGSYSCDVVDLREEENNETFLAPSDQERNATPTNVEQRVPSPSLSVEKNSNETSESPQPSTSKIDLSKIPLVLVEKKPEVPKVFPNPGPNEFVPEEKEADEIAKAINALFQSHLREGANNLACCLQTLNQAVCLMCGLGATLKDEERLHELLLRQETAFPEDLSLCDFLNEMSNGIVTISQIREAVDKIFQGTVTTKFFGYVAPYPINLNLSSWLQFWTNRGAVAMLCSNFNLTEDDCSLKVNSSWHYQLVFSTDSKGLNILCQDELISEQLLKELLTSPSEVLIHRNAVMTHWNPRSDLTPLMYTTDHTWKQYNVLGQVVNVIREAVTGKSEDEIRYIRVPSSHKSGILLLMCSDNIHINELLSFDDVPLHECI